MTITITLAQNTNQAVEAERMLGRVFNIRADKADIIERAVGVAIESQTYKVIPYKPVVFVALDGEKVIGSVSYISMAAHTGVSMIDNIPWFTLQNLGVEPAYRQQGIGRKLVQAAENSVREILRGEEGIIVFVDGTKIDNPRSMYYENMDYTLEQNPPYREMGFNETPEEVVRVLASRNQAVLSKKITPKLG